MPTKRILVVDDEEMVRMVIRMVLVNAGFHVAEAADGPDAIRQLAQPGPAYDLVLLDQNMPNMSGRETLIQLHQHAPSARVVMLSGMVGEELRQATAEAGVRFLAKPFQNQELIQVVQEALEE
jgi:CheY-like chemotaxis protein